ncbi:MAG: hypothetical protein BA862_05435 [Desulfobulbaceae bacterium S3730MH12]|nr:MAG: hypothetical protein BA862_05435 [Desulfobulbaceae bacterium S3730MH12]OEU78749.1 MAG: hypothetical protein BA873_03235 [Desulfobulbaceae bacterium C00003063]
MSIRLLAVELYRAQQKVDRIQKEIEKADYKEQESLKSELKVARKELQMLRKMLDGQKESGSFRKKFSKFSSFS